MPVRAFSISLALMTALTLAACGSGDGATSASAPAVADAPVFQLSFGSETPGATGVTTDTVVVCIQNYTHAQILEAGIRPFGSTSTYQGSLSGHNPATFGSPTQGGAAWVELGAGNYEGFLDTDLGRFEFVGHVPIVELPDGTYTVGPTCLYLFSLDLSGGGGTPTPPIGGGGGGGQGGGGGTFIPGGNGGGIGVGS